jgi:hypothetical protein
MSAATSMAKKTPSDKVSRLTLELLETAHDMHASALLTHGAYEQILTRHTSSAATVNHIAPSGRGRPAKSGG